jgi:hypothetical protein
MRAELEAEQRFIEERGGARWVDTYIKPFYLKWMGLGAATRSEVQPLIPEVRVRARELSAADIGRMVSMQWRIQVMGTWYAIARADRTFMEPVHAAFDACYGSLTAPGLTVAVLSYPNDASAGVLRAFRERAIARQYGDTGIITAALRRLEPDPSAPRRDDDDDVLHRLLDVASQLQDAAT